MSNSYFNALETFKYYVLQYRLSGNVFYLKQSYYWFGRVQAKAVECRLAFLSNH